jgi:N-acetylneuraminic acid mutarotase
MRKVQGSRRNRKLSLASIFLLLPVQTLWPAEPTLAPLPEPLSNNAVAELRIGKQQFIYSFMGIGPGKAWNNISTAAYQIDLSAGKWNPARPVPGPAGRLAASATGLHDRIFLFGGYVVDHTGAEMTVPDVSVYDPLGSRWYRGADIPVPVDDSVIGTYRQRYIYLVGGWSAGKSVPNVQVYDTEKDSWRQATSLPGTPVFGHAGAILDGTIVYIDGAYRNPAGTGPRYIASEDCWTGRIDRHDATKIEWNKIPSHPGNAHYRVAAGASEKDHKVYFSGGTDNPYNYNGIGYNGQLSQPSPVTFAWDLRSAKWELVEDKTATPIMDQRVMIATRSALIIVGGMEKDAKVTSRISVIQISH